MPNTVDEAKQAVLDYEEANAAYEEILASYEEQRDIVLSYVQEQLDDLNAEMRPLLDFARVNRDQLEKGARQAVLDAGETVNGDSTQFRWVKGKVTWDGQLLAGMMSIIPELKDARKEGKPSVSIYQLGGDSEPASS